MTTEEIPVGLREADSNLLDFADWLEDEGAIEDAHTMLDLFRNPSGWAREYGLFALCRGSQDAELCEKCADALMTSEYAADVAKSRLEELSREFEGFDFVIRNINSIKSYLGESQNEVPSAV
ncbi:hypothetical protein [Kordiimonas sp.]|uniref:hypothetical protein n=1 Tax=Kordiimonas sp. TaxID=1970157 RepID=UPI003A8E2F89